MNRGKVFSLGLQHVLAMYGGAIVVPLIVGGAIGLTQQQLTYLVAIDLFMCGVATLLQVWKNRFFGIGLPVVLGCTFTAVGPMISIGGSYGVSSIYGSIIVAGLLIVLLSAFLGKLVKFFPPLVTGSVVTIIGITLIPVAIKDLAGGEGSKDFGSLSNLGLGFGVLLLIIVLYRFTKGFMRSVSVLLGLVVGTIAASFMGKVDFSGVKEEAWVHMPHVLYFGMPTFNIMAILTMFLVLLVGIVESTGVYFAVSDICKKEVDEKDLSKGYRAEGLAILLGGFFNAFPYTAYSQNVGLLQLSGVRTRNVVFAASGILIVLGFLPKIAAVTTVIPSSVLGGAMVAMFGMVISSGIKILSQVDLAKQENLLVIACSVGMGLGVTVVPELFKNLPESLQVLTGSGIVMGSFTAIFLNIVFNMMKSPRTQVAETKLTNEVVSK
ncbi:nucleobase:cation symporter-2 family protein [Priestia megaterium]|uniref:nucleobase:cation symporter-2 family protein n=1 Tax=Priestia megaterium TaxID=1404 RepID=UPI00203F08EE|nr:nucleobase:cation symporter-2 family protein [Priestia megaterium]MCM3095376.1 purine permease [Priestia megaterium]MDH3143354.1 nucleobase:cation symporter-2 family protein [Priestia megaterium]MED4237695.1 nucleobase:cation symporter-2 family protein [Priestia megaterium]MED4254362.1 nucleobase:cation symporter-2 family protein [Priestia megaterium]MED4263752.1 nucleobase:cation symporter-2 family protein [Priestia megaterium]